MLMVHLRNGPRRLPPFVGGDCLLAARRARTTLAANRRGIGEKLAHARSSKDALQFVLEGPQQVVQGARFERVKSASLVSGGEPLALDRLDDLQKGQLLGARREAEPPAHTAHALQHAAPAQFVEDLGHGVPWGGGSGDEVLDAAVPAPGQRRQPQHPTYRVLARPGQQHW
jgi:hypothetical protein